MAEKAGGEWVVHQWAKKAVLLSFRLADNAVIGDGYTRYFDKVPAKLATEVAASVAIPVIGIGAGPGCDGQILVSHDMLGLYSKFHPRFVRRYAELGAQMRESFERYAKDVRGGNLKGAKALGKTIAERLQDKGIKRVVFDRGGFLYHGRLKAVADAAREAGLEF